MMPLGLVQMPTYSALAMTSHTSDQDMWLCLQKQQYAKEAEALAAAASAASSAAAEAGTSMPAATDDQKTNLVHAWVMVLAGKREVCKPNAACHILCSWIQVTI